MNDDYIHQQLLEEAIENLEDPCNPITCQFSYTDACVKACPYYNFKLCKRYPCDLFEKLENMFYTTSPHQTSLTDFIPEESKKEVKEIKDKIRKCLHKRLWLMKNKHYDLFFIPEIND